MSLYNDNDTLYTSVVDSQVPAPLHYTHTYRYTPTHPYITHTHTPTHTHIHTPPHHTHTPPLNHTHTHSHTPPPPSHRAYSSTEAISALLNTGQALILTGGLTAVSVAAVLGGLSGGITAGNLVWHGGGGWVLWCVMVVVMVVAVVVGGDGLCVCMQCIRHATVTHTNSQYTH